LKRNHETHEAHERKNGGVTPRKFQITNPKFQTNSKFESPKSQTQLRPGWKARFWILDLVLGTCLEFVIWNLELPPVVAAVPRWV
jgi:hypothetical protein